jgi:hypothetical protein
MLESLTQSGEDKIVVEYCGTVEVIRHLFLVLERGLHASGIGLYDKMILHVAVTCVSFLCRSPDATVRLLVDGEGFGLKRWTVCLANVLSSCAHMVETHESALSFGDTLAVVVNLTLVSVQVRQGVVVARVLREKGVLLLVLQSAFPEGRCWPTPFCDIQCEILCRMVVLFGLVIVVGSIAVDETAQEAVAVVDECVQQGVFEQIGRWFCNVDELDETAIVASLLILSLAVVLCQEGVDNSVMMEVVVKVKALLKKFVGCPVVMKYADHLYQVFECYKTNKGALNVDEWLDVLLPSPIELYRQILARNSGSKIGCSWCGRQEPKGKCSQCDNARYCDSQCQSLHWSRHKRQCL